MQLPTLIPAQFQSREKRFFIHTSVGTAHCPNTGSLKTILDRPLARLWLADHGEDTSRKLRYTAEIAEFPDGTMAVINTARANELAKEALTQRQIPPLATYPDVRMEAKWDNHTRFDALLTKPSSSLRATGEAISPPTSQCWVEVKSSTLQLEGGIASFPDAVTTRGQKHLQVLMDAVTQGHAACQLYLVMRSGANHFAPATHIDPTYAGLLKQAHHAGVQVLAHQATFALGPQGQPTALTLGKSLEIVL